MKARIIVPLHLSQQLSKFVRCFMTRISNGPACWFSESVARIDRCLAWLESSISDLCYSHQREGQLFADSMKLTLMRGDPGKQ